MRVRFGTFVLDSETRELLRGDVPVPSLPKRSSCCACSSPTGRRRWPRATCRSVCGPTTFVVEKNLANLIGEIRDALGDDPSSPRFIRTVHRFGYAFRETISRTESGTGASRAGEVSFLLKWVNGRVSLDEGGHTLGRDPDVEILLDSPGVSRRHALLTISAGSATIEDLGSKNGTFVGDQRVDGSRSLCDGDTITVGSVKLTLSVLHAPRSTETEPHASPRVKD